MTIKLPKAERRRLARERVAEVEEATRAAQAKDLKEAVLIIFTSPTGRPPWHPLKAEEVPDWVKDPKVMGRLVAGEECMDAREEPAGSNWYRAIRSSELNEAMKADQ